MVETKALSLDTAVKGVEPSRAAEIKATFLPMAEMLEKFEKACDMVQAEADEEITKDVCHTARRLRLDIKQVRLDVEKNRKAQKERALLEGKAIDGVANIFKHAVVEREDKLKEIETHFERIEEERIKKLEQERILELSKYDMTNPPPDLGKMDSLVWDNFLSGIKNQYDARIEAERKAREQREEEERKDKLYQKRREILLPYSSYGPIDLITRDSDEEHYQMLLHDLQEKKKKADEEQERIRQENEKLKKEAEERERKEREEKEAEEKRNKEKAQRFSEILIENGFTSEIPGVYTLGMSRVTKTMLLALSEEDFNHNLKTSLQQEEDRKEKQRLEDEKKRLEEEEKARREKEERIKAKEEEDTRLAAMASDSDKLFRLTEDMTARASSLTSPEAKNVIFDCIDQIQTFAEKIDSEVQQKA